jgi:hypothetical protein
MRPGSAVYTGADGANVIGLEDYRDLDPDLEG